MRSRGGISARFFMRRNDSLDGRLSPTSGASVLSAPPSFP